MTNNIRRDFLIRTGRAGLAVSIGTPLLGACYGEDVYEPTGVYDVIIVGGGAAGLIVATKLQRASSGKKRILLIEAGGPTTAAIGGKAYPPWVPTGRTDLTMFDVPGSYSQLAWTLFGTPYQLTETLWTYQGTGLGGNSVFNGMLFQTNPPAVFDQRWPALWHWSDMAPYFERVRARIPVTSTPSTDGVAQISGPATIVHPLYASAGWTETDTSRPFGGTGAYSRPYVAAKDGRRAGPITGYFPTIAPASRVCVVVDLDPVRGQSRPCPEDCLDLLSGDLSPPSRRHPVSLQARREDVGGEDEEQREQAFVEHDLSPMWHALPPTKSLPQSDRCNESHSVDPAWQNTGCAVRY